jgi:toxin ParE1/3/4
LFASQEAEVTLELTVRPEAETEINEAFKRYEERVSGLGSDFLLSVDAALQAILRNPQSYPTVHRTLRRALIRRFPYQIFFNLKTIALSF